MRSQPPAEERRNALSRHFSDTSRRTVGVRVVERVKDNVRGGHCPSGVHIVGQIVEMEQVSQEVVAYAKLRCASIRVAHGCEFTSLQTVELVPYLPLQIVTLEKPLFGFGSD